MTTRVIAIGNQKGGVGKTTNSLNICYSLANTYGKKTLLIDFDPQGSASLNLGLDIIDSDLYTINKVLEPYVVRQERQLTWDDIAPAIVTPTFSSVKQNGMEWVPYDAPFGFDVIPSALNLSVVEMEMSIIGGKYFRGIIKSSYMLDVVNLIKEHMDYDYIVIDTPPSLGPLSVNGMAAAKDGILISTNMDIMALRGIGPFIESAKQAAGTEEDHRGIIGIILSLYSDRRVVDRSIDDWIKKFLPIPTFSSHIPDSADAKKANVNNRLFAQVSKKAKTAYDDLTKEIMTIVEDPNAVIGNAKEAAQNGEE
ncbi:ParA family protein [Anaerolactibacter massiliensis]|uniref:ParA family protein n=1 Tax=Anaerolactibacter massiliensis TaxID=2044573 RepID=UPI000CFA1A87|nr:ParA family protein [Anaerolactibacter massiliensis]